MLLVTLSQTALPMLPSRMPQSISLVLGKLFETNLRRSLILSNGNPFVFVTRPVSCLILTLAVFMLFFPIISSMLANRKSKAEVK